MFVCVCDDDGVCDLCELTWGLYCSQFVPSPQREGGIQEGKNVDWQTRYAPYERSDFYGLHYKLQSNRLVSLESLTLNAPTDVPPPEGTTSSDPSDSSVTAHERWKKPLRCILDLFRFEEASSVFRWRTNGHPTLSFLFFCSVGLLETKNFACLCFCHLVRKKKETLKFKKMKWNSEKELLFRSASFYLNLFGFKGKTLTRSFVFSFLSCKKSTLNIIFLVICWIVFPK